MVFVRKRKDESLLREDASAVAIRAMADETKAGHRGAKETCHSAKRTHFIFAYFSMYPFYLQKLMPFAEALANGFVFEKRTHFGGVNRGSGCGGDQNEPKSAIELCAICRQNGGPVGQHGGASNDWTDTMRLLQWSRCWRTPLRKALL